MVFGCRGAATAREKMRVSAEEDITTQSVNTYYLSESCSFMDPETATKWRNAVPANTSTEYPEEFDIDGY